MTRAVQNSAVAGSKLRAAICRAANSPPESGGDASRSEAGAVCSKTKSTD